MSEEDDVMEAIQEYGRSLEAMRWAMLGKGAEGTIARLVSDDNPHGKWAVVPWEKFERWCDTDEEERRRASG